MLGAVWVTIPRQIEVVAERPAQPIYFELVEEEVQRSEEKVEIKEERDEKREVESVGVEAKEEVKEEEVLKEQGEEIVKEDSSERQEAVECEEQNVMQDESQTVGADYEKARVVAPPKAYGKIVPRYPKSARRKGREGCVVIEARIAEDGEVEHAKVVFSSGYEELDASAKSAVEKAKFEPAVENAQPIVGEVRMVFEFKLTK